VSTRGDYASRALLSLALHADESGPTSVRDIAERTGLPQPYLEQILLALKGAGLVRSKRGVGGGYVLARPPSEISLSEIVSAVDGPIVLGDFGQPHTDGACDHEGQCVLLAIWNVVGEQMRARLEAEGLDYLHAASLRLDGVSAEYAVRYGDPVEEILDEAESWNADLIAMTTRGRGSLERALLGSVAEEVFRKASMAVTLYRGPRQPRA